MSDRDREFSDSDTPGNLRLSPRIKDWQGKALRLASAVIDGGEGLASAQQKGEVVPSGYLTAVVDAALAVGGEA